MRREKKKKNVLRKKKCFIKHSVEWDPYCGTKTMRKIKKDVSVGVIYKSIKMFSKNKKCYK